MANNWGCNLVVTYGVCEKTFHQLDSQVRSSVPGFQLFTLEASGTSSNETAVGEATNYDLSRCLYAMGSYAGGSGTMQKMSSSAHALSDGLSLPMDPAHPDCSDRARIQTVAFPYWVECLQYTAEERKKLETQCLHAIHKRILICLMVGEPFKAILLELMLCGNGGELSNCFLEKLASLAGKYGITIIVDEVMTGGRVGPKITMTSSTPDSFRNRVGFITMGKVFNCGVVLKKVPKKPIQEKFRGNSTHLDAGEASMKWSLIEDRLKNGVHQQRREEVLSLFKIRNKPEESWGKGCLIFTSIFRASVTRGLKQRLLPMMETKIKLRKNGPVKKPVNRSVVCGHLKDSTTRWLEHMDYCNKQEWPFMTAIVECILDPSTTEITPDGIEAILGELKSNEMAELVRSKIRRNISCRNGKCDKKPKTFIRDAIAQATENCPGLIKRVRVGKKRKLIYRINREALHYDDSS